MGLISRFYKLNLHVKTGILLLILFFLYGLHVHFFDGVLPIHEWRKSDSLSIAWNYYYGASFWEPQTNFISTWGNRNAAAEFPIIYYIVGLLWKLFGQHEWIAKLFSFGTLLTGLILFSKVVNYFFQNHTKSLIFIGTIFSSPVLLFYADTLLPNLFSFSFLLYSSYFLFQFITKERKYAIIPFTLFLTLAILIKVTVLIAVFSFVSSTLFYYFFHNRVKLLSKIKLVLILGGSLIFAFTATYLWYSYAISYNEKHHSILFSTTIRPIWEVDAQQRKEIWEIIWKYQFNQLYHFSVLISCIIYVIYLTIKRFISRFFLWIISIGILGAISYFILWFWVFDVHDYYLVEILFLPLIFIFAGIYYLPNDAEKTKFQTTIAVSMVLIVFLQSVSFTQIAFGKNNIITKNTFFNSQYVKGNWGYFHWYHSEHLKKLQGQREEIQRVIGPKDTVFCITDPSPNVQLYTINRFGYTNYSFEKKQSVSKQLPNFIKKGAHYLLVVGAEPLEKDLSKFTQDTVYCKNGIFVFRLKHFDYNLKNKLD
jgi:hypothetical protein